MRQFPKLWAVLLVCTVVISSLGCTQQSQAAGNNTVEAILQVSFSKPGIFPSKANQNQNTVGAFEVFRNTQAALLETPFVLQSALVRQEIARLKVVLSHEPNPVHWLKNALEIRQPKNSELIILRLTDSGDAQQLRKVLDAVIAAYRREVLSEDMIREAEKRENLQKYYKNISSEYQSKLEKYNALSNELEAAGTMPNNPLLEMLKFELEVQRDFLKELARERIVINMNIDLGDSRVRIAQLATVVKD